VKEHRGSLEWLWKHPQYVKWSSSTTSSLLYIEGKPGSGKSTLAKYFKENLPEGEPRTVVHYFYTLRGTQLESTHKNMLRSILYRLLENDESVFFRFQLEFRKFRNRNPPEWPYNSLKTVLSSFAYPPITRPLYSILDAMDESEDVDRRGIIKLLCKLCLSESTCIKVFLASRPVPELTHQIEKYHHLIRLQNENNDDIRKFVEGFLPSLKLTGLNYYEAANYIMTNAKGVFVWVQLVKAELFRMHEAGHNDRQIMDRLKFLPTELVEFYNVMLERLEEEGSDMDIQDGILMFQFVLFAFRPLKILDLQHILAVPRDSGHRFKPSHQGFQQNLINEIETRILHCGGNFLEITGSPSEKDIIDT